MESSSLLIIGLGNFGPEYEKSRHNFGFIALDLFWGYLVENLFLQPAPFSMEKRFNAQTIKVLISGKIVYLIKPKTFMNLSGPAIKTFTDFYKIPPKNILLVHDELDLPLGKVRLSLDASAAGHNGVQSVIDSLGTKNFSRLRLGIEAKSPEENKQTIVRKENFVLENFTAEEEEIIQQTSPQILHFLINFINKS